jgi:hypothetical protein
METKTGDSDQSPNFFIIHFNVIFPVHPSVFQVI